MNDLAFIAIGLLLGIVLAVIVIAAVFLFWTASQMRRESNDARKEVSRAIRENTESINQMRGEVGLSLSQMDAQRLYEASVSIQKVNKTLTETVGQLNKVVFSSTPQGLDMGQTPGFGLADEAADDARMIEERNRWLAGQTEPVNRDAVNDFFEQRRKRNGIYPIGSTPPAETAYQAAVQQQPDKPVEKLPDLGGEDELSGAGELFK